jgi:hypothetical protein
MRSPFAAIQGMRRFFRWILTSCEDLAKLNPDAPVTINAGTSRRNPHGIASFTALIAAAEAESSEMAVDVQKVRMITKPIIPATG